MSKLTIEFDGFERMISELNKLGADVEKAAEEGLKKAKSHVTSNLRQGMAKHNQTGATVASLDESMRAEWIGKTATIHVGFNIEKGGLPSIFLMYGTPRMAKDQNLYNAIFGQKVKREVKEILEQSLSEAIRKAGG